MCVGGEIRESFLLAKIYGYMVYIIIKSTRSVTVVKQSDNIKLNVSLIYHLFFEDYTRSGHRDWQYSLET